MNYLFPVIFCLFAVVFAPLTLADNPSGSSASQTSSTALTSQQQFAANKQRLLDKIDQGDSKLQGAGLRDCIVQAQTPQDIRNNCKPQTQSNSN